MTDMAFLEFEFGDWRLFGICNLEFGGIDGHYSGTRQILQWAEI
jgi:hypothetical protein